ncbi:MAG: site-specific integrase [Clostridiales bacterium]|nr:site-specific integrase [Clostridiales bacterium]
MPAYNDKITGKWYAKFYYKDWQGNSKQKMKKGFKYKREAQQFEREFLDKAHADCTMTFQSLYDLYMEDAKVKRKPTTYENKRVLIELKILPYFKDQQINNITPAQVRQWQNKLISQNYKPTYLKTIHNQLTAMFNYAVKFYKLQENPAKICGSMGEKNADSMDIWTVDEFNTFIEAFNDKPLTRVAFELLFYSGMRSGELLALTYNDFDFENKKVSINKNFAIVKREHLILPPKTPKSKRVVNLPDFLVEDIEWLIKQFYDFNDSDRIFDFTKSHLNTQMKRGSKIAGVKKIRVHDIRHSHASLLVELGFSPLLIAERLGHEKVQTTMETYSHLYPNKQNEVTAKLQELVEESYRNMN